MANAKYEYRVQEVEVGDKGIEKAINAYASEGYELVQVVGLAAKRGPLKTLVNLPFVIMRREVPE